MVTLPNNLECCGCGVCSIVCPTQSIKMNDEKSLHSYPQVNSISCVDCHKCVKVCPVLNIPTNHQYKQKYFLSWNLNDTQRLKSTSGGLGDALMRHAIKSDYYVCGVLLDESWKVKHIVTNDINILDEFCSSKYVQSNTIDANKEILTLLKSGQKIFYVGTPCQVEALKNIVPIKYHNALLTCSIICHGVNSTLVWKDYVTYIEKKYDAKLSTYNFRSKSKGWQKKNGDVNLRVAYSFTNGIHKDIPAWRNLFHHWFGLHYILRPSCIDCKFRKEERTSDITMGDFWGAQKISQNLDMHKGISALIVSSQKGENFIDSCNCITKMSVSSDSAKKVLKGFIDCSTPEKKNSDYLHIKQFQDDYLSKSFETMVKKYPVQTIRSRIFSALKARIKHLFR